MCGGNAEADLVLIARRKWSSQRQSAAGVTAKLIDAWVATTQLPEQRQGARGIAAFGPDGLFRNRVEAAAAAVAQWLTVGSVAVRSSNDAV